MTEALDFQKLQAGFAAYLRDPEACDMPAGIETRRLQIYRDLIYNNIESFISKGFPVLRRLYTDQDWASLVRSFIVRHHCHSPYFLEIAQEFVAYLSEEHEASVCDPAFLLELAHYEWVELALDIAEEELPEPAQNAVIDDNSWLCLSPLAWSLAYQYPVHQIGPANRPAEPPAQPTYLVVYRDRADEVRFMESNALTARLLELAKPGIRLSELLERLALEAQPADVSSFRAFARDTVVSLCGMDILLS